MKEQADGAANEKYFALTMGAKENIDGKVGPAPSNYHLWWQKVLDVLNTNGSMAPEVI